MRQQIWCSGASRRERGATWRFSFAPRGSSSWRPQSYPSAARMWMSARPDCARSLTAYLAGQLDPSRLLPSFTCRHWHQVSADLINC